MSVMYIDMNSGEKPSSVYRDSISLEHTDQEKLRNVTDRVRNPPRRLPWLILFGSLAANILLAGFIIANINISRFTTPNQSIAVQAEILHTSGNTQDELTVASKYANLTRNVPKKWTYSTYTTKEEWDTQWKWPPLFPGIVALSDSYAQERGLPRAQRWPWDFEKGVYIVNGYHNLHCLTIVKNSLEEHFENLTQSYPRAHVLHCLLALREEILCNADDTPRYTSFTQRGKSGYGQIRMCRDWNQLEKWAMQPEVEGCWRDVPVSQGDDIDDASYTQIERFRFCSESNRYRTKAETMWKNEAAR